MYLEYIFKSIPDTNKKKILCKTEYITLSYSYLVRNNHGVLNMCILFLIWHRYRSYSQDHIEYYHIGFSFFIVEN